MAAKRPWYKWVTSIGAVIGGAGVVALNVAAKLPADLVVGTYHGAQVTAGLVTTILGAIMSGAGGTTAIIGAARKIENMKPNSE